MSGSVEGVEPEPFAYFQRNEGWDMWEQVAHEHRHEEGVVAAYRTTPPARSYADGVEDAAKVALKHSGMLAMAQGHDDAEGQADRWYEGGKHSAQVIAATIRLLSLREQFESECG